MGYALAYDGAPKLARRTYLYCPCGLCCSFQRDGPVIFDLLAGHYYTRSKIWVGFVALKSIPFFFSLSLPLGGVPTLLNYSIKQTPGMYIFLRFTFCIVLYWTSAAFVCFLIQFNYYQRYLIFYG